MQYTTVFTLFAAVVGVIAAPGKPSGGDTTVVDQQACATDATQAQACCDSDGSQSGLINVDVPNLACGVAVVGSTCTQNQQAVCCNVQAGDCTSVNGQKLDPSLLPNILNDLNLDIL